MYGATASLPVTGVKFYDERIIDAEDCHHLSGDVFIFTHGQTAIARAFLRERQFNQRQQLVSETQPTDGTQHDESRSRDFHDDGINISICAFLFSFN